MLDELLTQIPDVSVEHNTTFAELTTFRVGGRPARTVHCATADAAVAALSELTAAGANYLVVGGGSNLLVADDPQPVTVVRLDFATIQIAGGGLVTASAGVVWDELVRATVDAGLGGLECLSGIPGHVGAVPVQNVGAYGVEIADVLTRVHLFDKATGRAEWVPASALELSYRYSNLKFTGRGVVLAVEFQLTPDGLSAPLRFGQLTNTPGERRPAAQVRAEVLALRRGKGMVLDAGDHDTWSAGSFFTNPIVEPALADEIAAKVGEPMPRHPAGAKEKLSAAWLIERAGFPKGYPGEGPATLSTKHTLALTNRGGATAGDIVNLARDIQSGVRREFGVELEPEPIWLGF
ncbi:UDP-N-acetylenolpyruvoylglucosamine reductase [Corynebacterium phocae]|uniref:UDP-N-acetylenolpyruvoylglucosamine reductase n=1 Tax=Corynebacterium phocae TaxID=161895 RepID=A0A1L7D114_9CORY|nr:UDP-N-acetylmuramate dehydrogenase [Corynebacterium phocae]APT91790.1 UDP-N-acetylenolpyruvoylglucosamine reductase [Corynebacterium phocae]KAA8728459.1 UDP-N-acetylmuramate dehydrogenase [Corynebacterium phocae]